MTSVCAQPIPLEELIAYQLGELAGADEARVEEHYFECAHCTARLESVAQLRQGVAEVVRRGMVSSSVTADLIDHGVRNGLRIRSYRVDPGQQVACTAAPTDDFVAIRLGLDLDRPGAVDIVVEGTAVESGATETRLLSEATFDPRVGEVLLLFSGEQVRQFPRSRWTMQAVVHEPSGERRVGPYTLDHTPWDQLGKGP
ncbi:MAG: zf-HC2 domain-containing protein [Myxococcota bacterium]